ncbi:MAG: LysR family transcriptional regulator [Anaerostipes sp.]
MGKFYCALYKKPNITEVANMLYMTQPSLTKRLQQMEKEFDVTIVDRTPKGLVFTKEGTYLAKQAGYYLEFLKETKEHIEEMKDTEENKIIIGASYTYSKYSLADVLSSYSEVCPNTSFEIVNEQSDVLFRKMLEGSIDVGFIRGDYEGPVHKVLIAQNQGYLVTKEPMDINELQTITEFSIRPMTERQRSYRAGGMNDSKKKANQVYLRDTLILPGR